jgi:hypothetical protein
MSEDAAAKLMLTAHLAAEHDAYRAGPGMPETLEELTNRHVLLHQRARERGEEPEVVEHRVWQRRGLFGPRGPAQLIHVDTPEA